MLTFPTLITGTITGLRISAVDGTAFIDNAGATIPTYADGNHSIEIYDSSNRMLKGVLKAAGAGETLGSDLLSGWDLTSGWSVTNATIIDSNSFSTTESGGVSKVIFGAQKLYYCTYIRTGTSGTLLSTGAGLSQTIIPVGSNSGYLMITNVASIMLRNNAAGTTDVTSMSAQQVLTPSSSGATIVSAKGGAIYNFASKDASFTYNAASYRYAIYDTLKVSRPTRYMGVSTHNI